MREAPLSGSRALSVLHFIPWIENKVPVRRLYKKVPNAVKGILEGLDFGETALSREDLPSSKGG